MLKVKHVSKERGSTKILSKISFFVGYGQKIALVGENGVGKSTLLNIIAGKEKPDEGSIEVQGDNKIGYLPQTLKAQEYTVREYIRQTTGVAKLEEEITTLEHQLGEGKDVLETYADVREKYDQIDGYVFDSRIKIMLEGFGLPGEEFLHSSLAKLSSGQQSKVMLSSLLLQNADLLLLDEPTNNLDLPALIWLEEFVLKSNASFLIVSHDVQFLDKVVNKVLEIDWQNRSVNEHTGSYSDFLSFKEQEFNRQKAKYQQQQAEIKRLKDSVQKQKSDAKQGANYKGKDNDKMQKGFKQDRASKSGQEAKAVEKRIERMEKIEKPFEREPLTIPLDSYSTHKQCLITVENMVVGFSDGFSLNPISLSVEMGEKVAILGNNGAGKSTFLKTIIGELSPLKGSVKIDHSAVIGNFMQQHENLPIEDTALRYLQKYSDTQTAYYYLGRFGFDREKAEKKISFLSPGEKARLLLSSFAMVSANLLILDEPTNHLDLEAVDALKEVLRDYKGACILVSHDRDFLETIPVDTFFLLKEKELQQITEYQSYIQLLKDQANKLIKQL